MATLPEDVSDDLKLAIDELESAIVDVESRLESTRAERDDSMARQIELELENANLRRELGLARDRQGASAEILSSIAATSGDAESALYRIAETTARQFDAPSVTIRLAEGWEWGKSINFGASSHRIRDAIPAEQRRLDGDNLPGTVYRENRQIHIPDLDNIDPAMAHWPVVAARAGGTRTVAGTPLRRDGKAIGALLVYRDRLAPFTDVELALQQSFADQAVIAIENARLFNETQEALERQTATADILKVIASSPSDVQPVFDAIATSAKQLIGGFSAAVFRFVADEGFLAAFTPIDPAADEAWKASFPRRLSDFPPFDWVRDGEPAQVADTETVPAVRDLARLRGGFRSALVTPLMSNGAPIGLVSVTRKEPGGFAAHHVQLLQTFADQAVIAIENTRLFNETKEALERQTATAEILNVIASSPSDVQPVFDAIAASGHRLLGGFSTSVFSIVDHMLHLRAFTPINPAADAAFQASFPRPLSGEIWNDRMIRNGETVEIPDFEVDPTVPEDVREMWRKRGFRSLLLVPLVRSKTTIGMINTTRVEPGPFAAHHVQLLQTFADQAVIAIENTRLFNETKEALERQTATSDVLKVIASSPSNVQPVFDVIVERAVRLCGARMGRVYRYDGELIHMVGGHGLSVPGRNEAERPFPRPASDDTIVGRVILSRAPGILADLDEDETVPALSRQMIAAMGARSQVTMPMLLGGEPIGAITLSWAEPRGYSDQQITLLQTFADQAVIAIENVRLFNETREALERQTATADILKVIASSPSDVQPVFEAIAQSANRLIGGFSTAVLRYDGGTIHLAAFTPTDKAGDEALKASFPRPFDDAPHYQSLRKGEVVQIRDTEVDTQTWRREMARRRGFRSQLLVPLMNDGQTIGHISVTRVETGSFADHHIQLLQTFADQAVIAIENTRLFNEVQARTDDLSESLQQQTATADVLKVISRSAFDLETVMNTLARSASELCGADMSGLFLRENDQLIARGVSDVEERLENMVRQTPVPIDDQTYMGRSVLSGEIVNLADVDSSELNSRLLAFQKAFGYTSLLVVPLMREGRGVGVFALVSNRTAAFSQRQIDLVQTFADQAVIAIENVRLFDEVQARTRDLSESLQQQTATADVLKVISRSAFDLETVLDALLSSACRLCGADIGTIRYREGGEFRLAATFGCPPEWIEHFRRYSTKPDRSSVFGRTIVEGHVVHIPDLLADPDYKRPEAQKLMGFRAALGVPLAREGEPFGVINLFRFNVSSFEDKQIELVQTFADQAVIAIENVRLFDEVQARTRDLTEALTYQTGSANILKVIASSPTDVGPVLKAIVETACELCEAYDAVLVLKDGQDLRFSAHHGPIPMTLVKWPINRNWTAGRAFVDQRPVHVHDLQSPEGDEFPDGREMSRRMGHRTILSVPLLSEGESIGTIVLRRTEVHPFNDKQISLLETFADQAVIAIGNVRLFEEVQAKTRDLSEALTYQTGSSSILGVIASSPTDVTPVLNAIVESASELCEAYDAVVLLRDGDDLRFSAHHGPIPINVEKWPISRSWTAGRAFVDRKPVHVRDIFSGEGADFSSSRELSHRSDAQGVHTVLSVPLLRENESIGAILLRRIEVHPFSDKQIALLQTFADQAVIAIGNVRLFDEVQSKTRDLTEALTYQTGSANILSVIASSPTDVAPALRAIVESACELCEANDALVALKEDDELVFQEQHGSIPIVWDRQPIDRTGIAGRAIMERRPVHVHDLLAPEGDEFPQSREFARRTNVRTVLCVPLVREGESIGIIVLRRTEVQPFSEKQITLLQTFADQAVIAIGNVRLFEEVQAKTRDLTEALTYQTGSANILRVIASSPTDVEPVLKAIVESACELCDAYDAIVRLKDGNDLNLNAHHGPIPVSFERLPINRSSLSGRSVVDKMPIHVHDVLSAEGDEFPDAQRISRPQGNRTILSVPLLRENESVGAIIIRRREVNPFTDKQIALLQTFADQAVIAIGNVRLFEEVQAKTRDLSESLQFQTASSEVLKVISSSPDALQPVLDAIVQTSRELCGSDASTIFLIRDDKFHYTAVSGDVPKHLEYLRNNPASVDEPLFGRLVRERRTLHFTNVMDDPELSRSPRTILGGPRALLVAPLLRDGKPLGAIVLRQSHLKPFTPRQIQAIEVFADQAVIAISNVELFEEVQAKTRDLTEALTYQTGSANILKVIASSPTDVAPVLEAIVESACQLCDADDAVVHLRDGDEMQHRAHHGPLAFPFEKLPINRNWVTGRSIIDKVPIHVHDLLSDEGAEFPEGQLASRPRGIRTILSMPLLRENESIGAIVLRRTEVHPFSEKQISLLQTFADQAVIAIGNVRLFEEVQARTRELSELLEQQTATSEVLGVISRSAGDLEPVFQSMLENATRICGAQFGIMNLREGDNFRTVAFHNVPPAFLSARKDSFQVRPDSILAQMVRTRQFAQTPDLSASPLYEEGDLPTRHLVDLAGARTVLVVPMVKDNELVGTIGIYRREVLPFNEKQIALLSSFASQAVIAIENTRLLKELRQRTDDLSQSLDELRTAQDRLVQTEKLASLGQLTAGIAHEIKNPLNFVNNFAALSAELTGELNDALKQAAISDKIRAEVDELTGLLKDNLEKVVQHGKRADSIVKNMLLHSREGGGDHRPADINALIEESLNLAYHGARAERPDFNVTLQRDFDPSAGMLDMFPQEISRVFLNLVSNGFYAVTKRRKENGEGGFEPTLRATTKNLGDTVEIRIRDNGTGIPPEVKEKMFNPFFTTKPAGEGTGLGLSMSHDIIVKQHGGTIDVDTEPGHFTEFRIVLRRTGNISNKS